MYKVIKEVDATALIIRYKPKESEDEITEKNESRIGVNTKNALLNYSESVLKCLSEI